MKVENNQQSQPNMSQKMDEMLQQPAQPVAPQPMQSMQPMGGAVKVKKKKNIPAIALGVVAVLGIGAAAYFGVQYFGEKDRADNLAKTNASVQTESTETTSAETGEVASVSYGLYEGNITNKDANTHYSKNASAWSNSGLEVILDSRDNKRLHLVLTGKTLNEDYDLTVLPNTEIAQDKYISYDQEIADVVVAQYGQAVGDEVITVIMKDGTVQYTPVYKMLKEQKYESFGTLSGVKNAVKFYVSGAYSDNEVGSGLTTLVQTADGKIYDLYTLYDEAKVLQ